MQKITPFLWFDDQRRGGDELLRVDLQDSKAGSVTRYGEGGPGPAGKRHHATFELDGQQFMALNGGPHFKFTEAISFFVNCETQAEVDDLWNKLRAEAAKRSAAGSRTSSASPGRSFLRADGC